MESLAWKAVKTEEIVMIATFREKCWTPSEDQKCRVAGEMTGGSEKLSVVNLGESGCP
jgi:hypothetical protein